ncbi:transposase [Desulfolutivibrio sulfoxidireducens]|uniref:transposase n=1 Tax=Desulfolutivibrio sulfoxidireducens TaxID=2773299 RepID=UPI00159DADC7|nr:transposase [Desulfolutivibrio sulfoxidireducens]QLA20302.1 transposase [Desulfolutivibrio sulfoxidireducens]
MPKKVDAWGIVPGAIHSSLRYRRIGNRRSFEETNVSYSDDVEAAWLRKGNRAYYGYKIHAATDSQDGDLPSGHVTPANRSDTEGLPVARRKWSRARWLRLRGQRVLQPVKPLRALDARVPG